MGRSKRLRPRDLARIVRVNADAARPLNPMRPDSGRTAQLPLSEVPWDDRGAGGPPLINGDNSYVRAYRLGECSVLVTREFGGWHLSIAHPARDPTWDEISQARYRILPLDTWMAIYLPPPEEYVNLHRFCFHVFECDAPGHPRKARAGAS